MRYKEETDDKPAVTMIPVTVIASKGASSLIQWVIDGKTKRAFVPIQSVVNDECSAEALSMSAPYGTQWEKFVEAKTVRPEAIADALRAEGFWTHQEIENEPGRAQSVVDREIGIIAATICRLARQADREANDGK